jgi:hypothetical protein
LQPNIPNNNNEYDNFNFMLPLLVMRSGAPYVRRFESVREFFSTALDVLAVTVRSQRNPGIGQT